jgi:hypothetical protein
MIDSTKNTLMKLEGRTVVNKTCLKSFVMHPPQLFGNMALLKGRTWREEERRESSCRRPPATIVEKKSMMRR